MKARVYNVPVLATRDAGQAGDWIDILPENRLIIYQFDTMKKAAGAEIVCRVSG